MSKLTRILFIFSFVIILIGCGDRDSRGLYEKASNINIKKTGQTISYYPKDDGYYQKGVTPSYTRDDDKEIVMDNITKLQWQDNEEVKTVYKNWEDAKAYCSGLTLGGYADWRLPTIIELQTIIVDGKSSPTIDTTAFVNYTISNYYWSSTTSASSTNVAWSAYFHDGDTFYNYKLTKNNVRCARVGE